MNSLITRHRKLRICLSSSCFAQRKPYLGGSRKNYETNSLYDGAPDRCIRNFDREFVNDLYECGCCSHSLISIFEETQKGKPLQFSSEMTEFALKGTTKHVLRAALLV